MAKPQYQVVTPFYYNVDVFGVVNDRHSVIGFVQRNQVRGYRFENRSTFKHPAVGLVFGLVLIGIPIRVFAGATAMQAWWLAPLSLRLIGAYGFLFVMGILLIWEVLKRRDEPWIVFVTDNGEKAFPVRRALTPAATKLLVDLFGEPIDARKSDDNAPR